MFRNLMNNKIVVIDISFDEMLKPFWDLMIALTENKTQILKEIDLSEIDLELNNTINKKIDELEELRQSSNSERYYEEFEAISLYIFNQLSLHLKNKLFNTNLFDKYIKKSCQFALKNSHYIFYVPGSDIDKFKGEFARLIKVYDPIKLFLSEIFKGRISDNIIKSMYSKDLYDIAIDWETANYIDIENSFYSNKLCSLEDNNITIEPITENSYWLNENFITKLELDKSNINIENVIKLVDDNKTHIGYRLNNYFIPSKLDWKKHLVITDTTLLIWHNIKNEIYRRAKNENEKNRESALNKIKKDKLIVGFMNNIKDEHFSSLLSQLEDNLYLLNKPESNFEEYFDALIIHENLKKFENFRFLTANTQKDDSMLGIYKINKEHKEDSYNLMHFITDNDPKKICWRSIDYCKTDEAKKIVYALKPNVAYYYISEYFEDLFKMVLENLKTSLPQNFEYVTNYKITCSKGTDNEIDAIVYYNDKIYFIELKTTLSIDYIRSYQNKCNKWMDELSIIDNNIEFIIIGAQAKEELHIFNSEPDKSAPDRTMKVYPYHFEVPLNKNKKLKCFTEPSFDRLTQKLVKIFQ